MPGPIFNRVNRVNHASHAPGQSASSATEDHSVLVSTTSSTVNANAIRSRANTAPSRETPVSSGLSARCHGHEDSRRALNGQRANVGMQEQMPPPVIDLTRTSDRIAPHAVLDPQADEDNVRNLPDSSPPALSKMAIGFLVESSPAAGSGHGVATAGTIEHPSPWRLEKMRRQYVIVSVVPNVRPRGNRASVGHADPVFRPADSRFDSGKWRALYRRALTNPQSGNWPTLDLVTELARMAAGSRSIVKHQCIRGTRTNRATNPAYNKRLGHLTRLLTPPGGRIVYGSEHQFLSAINRMLNDALKDMLNGRLSILSERFKVVLKDGRAITHADSNAGVLFRIDVCAELIDQYREGARAVSSLPSGQVVAVFCYCELRNDFTMDNQGRKLATGGAIWMPCDYEVVPHAQHLDTDGPSNAAQPMSIDLPEASSAASPPSRAQSPVPVQTHANDYPRWTLWTPDAMRRNNISAGLTTVTSTVAQTGSAPASIPRIPHVPQRSTGHSPALAPSGPALPSSGVSPSPHAQSNEKPWPDLPGFDDLASQPNEKRETPIEHAMFSHRKRQSPVIDQTGANKKGKPGGK